MADVFSNIYPAPAGLPRRLIDSTFLNGSIRRHGPAKVIINNQANGDRAFVAKIPSHAIMINEGFIDVPQIAGATSITFGGGPDPDALVTAFDVSATGSQKNPLEAIAAVDLDKRLWELLGFTSDPKSDIDLLLTFANGSTNTADRIITSDLRYVLD